VTERVVVGVDGGGTSTSAVVVDLRGNVLGSAEGGGASPEHNCLRAAHDAVQGTIRQALDDADRTVSEVTALTAGLAGHNDEHDQQWARALVTLPELPCDPHCVNDAVVAHAGALEGERGIVAICGTGSIVLGIDGDGRLVRNYDLDHYAEAAARHLGRRLVHRLVGGEATEEDQAFVDAVLSEWGVEDTEELRRVALDGDLLSTAESENALDGIAPLVTRAAETGVPLARSVCEAAAREITTGIRAVGGYLDRGPTTVALEGGVLRSKSMRDAVVERLAAVDQEFAVREPAMSPAAGAALLALERADGEDTAARRRLRRDDSAVREA